jgi:hypothetical protein
MTGIPQSFVSMTFKSIADTDPWPLKCPDPDDLEIQELLSFVEDYGHASLSDWECDLCQSLLGQLRRGKRPSDKQYEILARGLFKKLWDNDPNLWVEN